ncbi:unnamed protein product, partial [Ascophyllum nodosum]
SSEPESPRGEGALADYFSALFDESFCCHEVKLVGSRIFSSHRFEEEQAADLSRGDGRDDGNCHGKECSDGRAEGDSNESMESSVGSSPDLPREGSTSHLSDGDPWGWFDELEDSGGAVGGAPGAAGPPVTKATPTYILTESLSVQRLWRETAGRRPRQPSPERAYFEEQWAKNFSGSEVDYSTPLRTPEAFTNNKRSRKTTRVLYRAASPFGSAVSKTFMCDECNRTSSIMVHIPKFQIVKTGSDVHAEYLIVVGLGAVTLGVWRRFSEFKRLAKKLASSSRRHLFHNTLCSWRCLTERQRWFRCLDRDYLVLKTFLLERFLHDFVFESVSPNTVRDFLGVL